LVGCSPLKGEACGGDLEAYFEPEGVR
jgi:hypothetical protein